MPVPISCKNCSAIFLIRPGRLSRVGGVPSYCSRSCKNKHWRGFSRSQEFKDKVRRGMTGIKMPHAGKPRPHKRGALSNFWRGGVSKTNRSERKLFEETLEYRVFRRGIFKRDRYTCTICGDTTKVGHKIKIQLDHIKPYALFPDLRMSPDNVRTVCVPCHRKTDTFGLKTVRLMKEVR